MSILKKKNTLIPTFLWILCDANLNIFYSQKEVKYIFQRYRDGCLKWMLICALYRINLWGKNIFSNKCDHFSACGDTLIILKQIYVILIILCVYFVCLFPLNYYMLSIKVNFVSMVDCSFVKNTETVFILCQIINLKGFFTNIYMSMNMSILYSLSLWCKYVK